MTPKDQEKLRSVAEKRRELALATQDVEQRKNLLEGLKKTFGKMFPDLDFSLEPKPESKPEENLLPRTGISEHDQILAQCEKNLKGVPQELRDVFFQVAIRDIKRSIAPLDESEKKKLPPDKLAELEKDPVKARQEIFKIETENKPTLKKKLPVGLKSSERHLKPKEPPRWVVEDVLPEGLTFLGSKAFGGKSLLSVLLAEQFIRGAKFLERFEVFTGTNCDVLYFDWEKVEADIVKRLEKIDPPDPRKGDAMYFALDTEGQPHNQNELISCCNGYLTQNPKIKIIVIDTLPRITAEKTGGDSEYHWETRILGELQNWAKVKRVAVLALLHTTKYFNEKASNPFDSFLGGMGLQGVADCCWLLLRPKGNESDYGEFLTQCKVGDMKSFAFEAKIEKSVWSIIGDLKREQSPKTTRTKKEEQILVTTSTPTKDKESKILEILKNGPKTPKEISEALQETDTKENTKTRYTLVKMKEDGKIFQPEKYGAYFLKDA